MKRNEDWGWGSAFGVIGGIVFFFTASYFLIVVGEALQAALKSQM